MILINMITVPIYKALVVILKCLKRYYAIILQKIQDTYNNGNIFNKKFKKLIEPALEGKINKYLEK